jgi:hypothetical protein
MRLFLILRSAEKYGPFGLLNFRKTGPSLQLQSAFQNRVQTPTKFRGIGWGFTVQNACLVKQQMSGIFQQVVCPSFIAVSPFC